MRPSKLQVGQSSVLVPGAGGHLHTDLVLGQDAAGGALRTTIYVQQANGIRLVPNLSSKLGLLLVHLYLGVRVRSQQC